MKDYNVMAKGNHFDLLIKLMEQSNENFANLALGHGDNHARGCLLDLKNSWNALSWSGLIQADNKC